MAEVSVGEKIPYFEMPDQQGYPWSLSGELELGPVVLVFYRGDWCAYCNGQLASYARRFEEFEERSAAVAGVSVDPPQNNARMVGKPATLPAPQRPARGAHEAARPVGRAGWRGGPSVIVIDRSGEIRYLYTGSDLADRPDEEEVLAALRGIPAGIERITGEPEIVVPLGRPARRASARTSRRSRSTSSSPTSGAPSPPPPYWRAGSAGGPPGRKAVEATSDYQTLVRAYRKALQETAAPGARRAERPDQNTPAVAMPAIRHSTAPTARRRRRTGASAAASGEAPAHRHEHAVEGRERGDPEGGQSHERQRGVEERSL